MKQATTLTAEQVVQDLRELVAEYGENHVYSRAGQALGCRYFEDDGSPSCGVGHVFAKHGVTLDDLVGINTGTAVLTVVADDVIDISPEGVRILDLFQSRQDEGIPWGPALDDALRDAEWWFR